MYRREEVEAKVGQMPPALRGLVEEMLRRGEFFAVHMAPVEETLDSDFMAHMKLVLSEPALRQEFREFWQDYAKACHEDAAAIMRGEHDHEL